MEIQIGRDAASSRLMLTINGKKEKAGPSNVPATVSPEHCLIVVSNDYTIKLKNSDINNYTYVNGQAVEVKTISKGDRIELGCDHYLLEWDTLEKHLPPIADIHPLKDVWEHYEQQNIDLQIDERRFNTLRSITGLITMIAIVLSIATGGRSKWYFVLYGLAITASLIFFIKAYRDAAKIPQQRKELTKKFQREYTCPHCGHFLGSQPYEILTQNSCCPYCKAKFIH